MRRSRSRSPNPTPNPRPNPRPNPNPKPNRNPNPNPNANPYLHPYRCATPDNAFVVGCIGSYEERKAQSLLLKAAKKLEP